MDSLRDAMSISGKNTDVPRGAALLGRLLVCLLAVAVVALGIAGQASAMAHSSAASAPAEDAGAAGSGHEHEAAAGRDCLTAGSCWTITTLRAGSFPAAEYLKRFAPPASAQMPKPLPQSPPDQPPRLAS